MSVATIDNKTGGAKLVDINSTKLVDEKYKFNMDGRSQYPLCLPIQGYSKLCLYNRPTYGASTYFAFVYENGDVGTYQHLSTDGSWTEVDIPSNALMVSLYYNGSGGGVGAYYALIA